MTTDLKLKTIHLITNHLQRVFTRQASKAFRSMGMVEEWDNHSRWLVERESYMTTFVEEYKDSWIFKVEVLQSGFDAIEKEEQQPAPWGGNYTIRWSEPNFDSPKSKTKTLWYSSRANKEVNSMSMLRSWGNWRDHVIQNIREYIDQVEEYKDRRGIKADLDTLQELMLKAKSNPNLGHDVNDPAPKIDWFNDGYRNPVVSVGDVVRFHAYSSWRYGVVEKIGKKYMTISFVTFADPNWIKTTKRNLGAEQFGKQLLGNENI